MALPTLNATPQYSLTVPSTGNTLKYRPYLVKEEKVLLMAAASEDSGQIMQAIYNTISSCVENVNVSDLTTFDLEYVFIQLRAKSTGETTTIGVGCPECGHNNPVEINLEEITCTKSDASPIVKISDDVTVELKYPSYTEIPEGKDAADVGFNLIAASIKTVTSGDERIDVADEPFESVIAFLESMTQDQFAKITAFFETSPTVKYDINLECEKCGTKNDIEVKGMQSFF